MPGLYEVIVYNRQSTNDDNSCTIQLHKFSSAQEKKCTF